MGKQIENNYIISLIKSKLLNSFNLKLEESRTEEWTVYFTKGDKLLLAGKCSEGNLEDFATSKYSSVCLLSQVHALQQSSLIR